MFTTAAGFALLLSDTCSPVYGMLAFEWVQTGLLTAGGFTIFVDHYGDIEELTNICYGWLALAMMVAVVSVIVQGFFAWRIYMLSHLRVLVAVILTVSDSSTYCCINYLQAFMGVVSHSCSCH